MRLTLSVLRCPPAVAPETRTLTGGEFTIGRGPGVDWALSDVNHMVSRRHCTLAFRAGSWQIIDDSANGTFANHDEESIGKGNQRSLRDHDRLRIGPYEIEVHVEEEDMARKGDPGTYPDPVPTGSYADDPFADPLWPTDAVAPRQRGTAPAGDTTPFGRGDGARTFGNPFADRTQDDHSSVLDDAMRPPNPIGQMPVHADGTIPADDLLPEGWENDLLAGLSDPVPTPNAPMPPGPMPAAPMPAGPMPAGPMPPGPALANATAPPRPVPADQAPLERAAPARYQSTEPAPSPDAAFFTGGTALIAAFLAGVGLPDARLADPAATMQRLGETFRALVSGLRAVLIARASIKSEFRIEQTLIRPRDNNPLKFSANDDDAISALLGVGRHTGVTPAKAVTDALRDIRLHELASMAAMQSAVRTLLQGLDPETVRAAVEQGGRSLLPSQKKARAWDAYEALHARIGRALSDDFDSVFGKAFARAYEEALADLTTRDRP